MISYSVTMSLAVIIILLMVGTINYFEILESQIHTPLVFALLPIFFILVISCVAELGRSPMDNIEDESVLVSGHFTEYSGVMFAYFFLAEYSMMLFMGIFITILLLGIVNPLPFLFLCCG